MKNIICYLCNDNLVYQEYEGTKLLDDNGDKPCFECLLEAGIFDEVPQEEVENEQ